ncbi:MAG: hypothetical protein A2002_01420 [Pseudomonadales bacterium GWC1_66_9]|nr:MAG: hypothetical protein A2002_01420 [Pseudomonadales bacterium GWC1_66_9]
MKRLYLLKTSEGLAMVVRAACETCARGVAADNCGSEGTAVWRDPSQTACKEIRQDGKSGLVLAGVAPSD